MKLIPSRTRVLEGENAALELEVARLQAELQRAHQMYKESWAKGNRGEPMLETAGTNHQIPQTQSYLRPTITSKSRAKATSRNPKTEVGLDNALDETQSVQILTGLEYDDGKLVVQSRMEKAGFANFMKHTKSTRAKSKRTTWDELWAFSFASSRPPTPELDRSSPESEQSREHSTTCEQCEYLEKRYDDETDQSLHIRSRLGEPSFFQHPTPAPKCSVPFRTQCRLLKTALRLAQETLWTALRAHWPEHQRQYYLEGPEQVKFGRDELYYAGFGNGDFTPEVNDMCGQPRSHVKGVILSMVGLRNAVCHPGYRSTQEIDDLLRSAQALAVVLQDEKRTFKIRRLRDDLQTKAAESYEEIKARVGMAALPFAKPWPLYLQRFFDDINVDLRCGYAVPHPVEVVYAARMWKLMYTSPGTWHPTYLSNVAKAKSFMRSTSHGRRASVDVAPNSGANKNKKVKEIASTANETPPGDFKDHDWASCWPPSADWTATGAGW